MFHRLNKIVRLYFKYYTNRFAVDSLIFFITDRCNFRCKTCFNVENMEKANASDLSLDEIRKISNSIGKFNDLLISGGEPFLRDDLTDICEFFYLQNKIKSLHLPTNGFYTDKVYSDTRRILEKCPGLDLTLSLPLDGLKETHDLIKGVDGSFEKVEETIKRLSTLKKNHPNLTIYIITVVNKLNLYEIVDLSEYIIKNLPVDDHGPSPMRGEPYDKNLSPDETLERRRQSLLVDLYLTGTNAVTESGQLVNLDMIGNRIGGITFGPKHVIILVGRNKISSDLDEALFRVKNYAAPVNTMRLDKKTPCAKTSYCEECKSPDRICNTWTITEKSFPKGRVKVVLINDDLGF